MYPLSKKDRIIRNKAEMTVILFFIASLTLCMIFRTFAFVAFTALSIPFCGSTIGNKIIKIK